MQKPCSSNRQQKHPGLQMNPRLEGAMLHQAGEK